MSKSKHLLLLGAYGRGNIGDDAFLIAAVRLLEGNRITINASKDSRLPAEVEGKVETLSTGSLKDWRKKLMTFATIDTIVYGGGDLWVLLHGNDRPTQTLWVMAMVNVAAHLLGKKIYYVGCGAGNLGGFPLKLARISAHMADGVIARDSTTLQTLNLPRSSVLPDLTITLFPTPPPIASLVAGQRIKLVISVLYHIPDPTRNFEKYIDAIANCIRKLGSEHYDITLLPMLSAPNVHQNDSWASEYLVRKLKITSNVTISRPTSVDDCIAILSGANVVIGSRLHANILATWLGKPSIGIAYRSKVRRFFEENQLGGNCLELDELNDLAGQVEKIIQDYDSYAKKTHAVWQDNSKKGKAYAPLLQTKI